MPVVQPMAPAAGLRPPVPGIFQQNARVPSMGGSPANQLSNGEQNSADTNFHESAETEKNVQESCFFTLYGIVCKSYCFISACTSVKRSFFGSLDKSEGNSPFSMNTNHIS